MPLKNTAPKLGGLLHMGSSRGFAPDNVGGAIPGAGYQIGPAVGDLVNGENRTGGRDRVTGERIGDTRAEPQLGRLQGRARHMHVDIAPTTGEKRGIRHPEKIKSGSFDLSGKSARILGGALGGDSDSKSYGHAVTPFRSVQVI